MRKAVITDRNIAEKTALVRVDFNVPLNGGSITDDTRIRAAIPTIEYLIEQKCRVILCSHLSRPRGQVVPEMSLRPCAERLAELTGRQVRFVEDCIGPQVEQAVAQMQPGDLSLLENTRFYADEEAKDEATIIEFGKKLAAPADFFVNDAFGACHRNHGSTYGVTKYLSPCVAGFLVELEIRSLSRILNAPEKGFIVVLGGAKVEDKIGVIESLLPKCEKMLIGGAMTWAFLKARGYEVGMSLCQPASVKAAREVDAKMSPYIDKLMVPVDAYMRNVAGDQGVKYTTVDAIEPGWDALDIGDRTREMYADLILKADNVFWNGPMGKFEDKPFDEGTLAVARAMGDCPGFNVVGGGDSVAAVTQMGVADAIDHISTGGGASLEYLEDGTLSAVEALDDK
jgi:phosphoglycerate kinase